MNVVKFGVISRTFPLAVVDFLRNNHLHSASIEHLRILSLNFPQIEYLAVASKTPANFCVLCWYSRLVFALPPIHCRWNSFVFRTAFVVIITFDCSKFALLDSRMMVGWAICRERQTVVCTHSCLSGVLVWYHRVNAPSLSIGIVIIADVSSRV